MAEVATPITRQIAKETIETLLAHSNMLMETYRGIHNMPPDVLAEYNDTMGKTLFWRQIELGHSLDYARSYEQAWRDAYNLPPLATSAPFVPPA